MYNPHWIVVLNWLNACSRATSRINGVTYLPWSDADLADLKGINRLSQDFEDPCGLIRLSDKQRARLKGWVRPSDICENPQMVYLISSLTIKQVPPCRIVILHTCVYIIIQPQPNWAHTVCTALAFWSVVSTYTVPHTPHYGLQNELWGNEAAWCSYLAS